MDSLGVRNRKTVMEKIKTWLQNEAKVRTGKDTFRKLMSGVYPRVPLQQNTYDCGCFLIECVTRFMKDPKTVEANLKLNADLSCWFTCEEASERRAILSSAIEACQKDYDDSHPIVIEPGGVSASSDIEEITEVLLDRNTLLPMDFDIKLD